MAKNKPLLSDSERLSVNQAISAAERRTAAEIVPAVARASGRYDRPEDIVGLWIGILACGVTWYLFQDASHGGGWSTVPEIRVGFWIFVVLLVVGFIVGAVLADRMRWLRRLFTSAREMDQETVARAKTVFYDRRVHRTRKASGVLLYVSIYERRVVILADDSVREQLSERSLEEAQDEALAGLQGGSIADGLRRGIDRLGQLLEVALPAGADDENEVFNEIVLID